MSTKIYTIKQVEKIDSELANFFIDTAIKLNEMHGDDYDLRNFDIKRYCRQHRVMVVRRKGKPCGVSLMRLTTSVYDWTRVQCIQDLIYAQYPRATYLLIRDFIDYGSKFAEDTISMIGPHTNIKESSLARLGFEKLETVYNLRSNHG